jgi:hypothetical protein
VTVAYSIEGIARVRVRPLVLDVSAVGPVALPGALEVTWDSTQRDRWHQVYAGGRLAGVTAKPEDRNLVISAPSGREGPSGPVLIEVVAVDAADRATDFGEELSGFGEGDGSRVRLTWQAGRYLDPDLESFNVYADGASGTVDYETPLNELPIPARPDGAEPWGYGAGGFGVGGYGASAARYEWTTDPLVPGSWRMAVLAVDGAGNRLATAAEIVVQVTPLPRPPKNFRVLGYDAESRKATLAWDASPDV